MTSLRQHPSLWLFASTVGLALACAPYESDDLGADASSSGATTTAGTSFTGGEASTSSSSSGEAGSMDGGNDTAGSTDSSDGTDGSTDTADDDGGFVSSDLGQPTGDCSTWVLDDCDEGEKCTAVHFDSVPEVWDTTVCMPIMGDKAPGDECTVSTPSLYSGEDDCGNGSLCWNVDKITDMGTCIAFCQGSAQDAQCPDGTSCWIAYDGVLPVCTTDCDPLAQDCPLDGEICLPRPDEEGYGCFQEGVDLPGDYGEVCGAFNFCSEGLLCIEGLGIPDVMNCNENTTCCSPLCSISGGEPCPGMGQSCEPVFETQPAGFEDVGICTLPI